MFFFLGRSCGPRFSSWTVTVTVLSQICVRRTDNKQTLGLVKSHHTTHDKNFESKYDKRGTQATCLGPMIGRCSRDSQRGRPDRLSADIDCSFFGYTNDNLRKLANQRRKHKTWTWEDNQLPQHCYFRGNRSQRGYRKRTKHYIPETRLTDYMYQERMEENNLPALKTALTHRYNNSRTT